jgi:hypothetical protein
MQNGSALVIEMKNASVSWPERVLPAASISVPEMKSGNFLNPNSLKNYMYAKMAALAFKESKIVSIKIM